MKIACVVHRFGAEIAGGSEGHCRAVARRLAAAHDVTVLTTSAADHVTWRNRFPAGESLDEGVRVRRFPVVRERALSRYGEITERVFRKRHSFRQMSTRHHYPGRHQLVIAINGAVVKTKRFELL